MIAPPPLSIPTAYEPTLTDLPTTEHEPSSQNRLSVQETVCPTCHARYPNDFVVCPKDATKLHAAPQEEDPLIGSVLANTYRVVRVIGEGGMGRVYEAYHLRLATKRYAIKALHREHIRNAHALARFQREAEVVASIHHENIVEVFDLARTEEGQPFLVEELLEGQDFHDFLEQTGKLDALMAVRMAQQMARALQATHEAGVVHRDLKPENLFVVYSKNISEERDVPLVKLLDFGISKVQTAEVSLTSTGAIVGTPNYMSPEQARGEDVDSRADVYALGAILYRMSTGKRAFEGAEARTVLAAVLTEEPMRPRTIESSIPEELEMVIQRAMAKQASERYQNMSEFQLALAQVEARLSAIQEGVNTNQAQTASRNPPSLSNRAIAFTDDGLKSRWSRPTIVFLTILIFTWILALSVSAIAGIVRISMHREITKSESSLMWSLVIVAAITPLIGWLTYVLRNVWPNSVRAVEMAQLMRHSIVNSFLAYGVCAILSRVIFIVIVRSSLHLIVGWLDVFYFIVAGIVGIGTILLRQKINDSRKQNTL